MLTRKRSRSAGRRNRSTPTLTAEDLIEAFRALGASDPETLASSQLDGRVPELHRFAFLKRLWDQVADTQSMKWIDQTIEQAEKLGEDDPQAAAGLALRRMLAAGVDPNDILKVLWCAQAEMIYNIAFQLDDPEFAVASARRDAGGRRAVGAVDGQRGRKAEAVARRVPRDLGEHRPATQVGRGSACTVSSRCSRTGPVIAGALMSETRRCAACRRTSAGMQPMKRPRIINAVLAVVFLALSLALPVRGLLSSGDVAADAAARGTVVFNAEDVNAGAKSAQYIMLFLFGSLALVFAWRAIKPPSPPAA